MKMNRLYVCVFVVLCVCNNALARKDRLYIVSVPDTITVILEDSYYNFTKKAQVNAGVNVHNVINYKDTTFANGLYCFGGMGPHFPKILFIYYNSIIYIIGEKAIPEVMRQFVDAHSLLQMQDKDYLLYVRHALDFIEESYGDDYSYYGIKTDNHEEEKTRTHH